VVINVLVDDCTKGNRDIAENTAEIQK